ncbi:hypothetical protein MCOR01_011611 [Pyricularia oryzae]|nr:hypothetical protein MCOR01_011611 [Pyricularia oryzae]
MTFCGVKFDPEQDMPDLRGKVILVTGGNTGLGLESIRQLAQHNPAHIYMGRGVAGQGGGGDRIHPGVDAGRGLDAHHAPGAGPGLVCEHQVGGAHLARGVRPPRRPHHNSRHHERARGPDRRRLRGPVRHQPRRPGALDAAAAPRLKRTAALPGSGDVRVVFLSSALERSAESGLLSTPDRLKTTMPETGTQSRYANSKLANIHYAWALAEQNPDLKVVSVHPGVVQTGLLSTWKDGFNPIVKGAINLAGRALMTTIEKGAYNQLWAATAAEGVETGTFYWPVGVKGKGTKASKDVKQRDALWAWTQKELNGHLFV